MLLLTRGAGGETKEVVVVKLKKPQTTKQNWKTEEKPPLLMPNKEKQFKGGISYERKMVWIKVYEACQIPYRKCFLKMSGSIFINLERNTIC